MNDALTCQFSKGHCTLIPKLSRAFFGKFQRQCVNVIDTTWGRIYFFTCENFGRKFQTAVIFNSLKISSWASDKRLKKVWCVPVATWLAMLAYRCSKVSSFTLVICFVYKVTPYFTSTVLWLLISGALIVSSVWSIMLLYCHIYRLRSNLGNHLQVHFTTAEYDTELSKIMISYRLKYNIYRYGPVYHASLM